MRAEGGRGMGTPRAEKKGAEARGGRGAGPEGWGGARQQIRLHMSVIAFVPCLSVCVWWGLPGGVLRRGSLGGGSLGRPWGDPFMGGIPGGDPPGGIPGAGSQGGGHWGGFSGGRGVPGGIPVGGGIHGKDPWGDPSGGIPERVSGGIPGEDPWGGNVIGATISVVVTSLNRSEVISVTVCSSRSMAVFVSLHKSTSEIVPLLPLPRPLPLPLLGPAGSATPTRPVARACSTSRTRIS